MNNKIDLKEKFPYLTKAPIIEAALNIHFVPVTNWEDKIIEPELIKQLPDYPLLSRAKLKIPKDLEQPDIDFGYIGFKFKSQDSLNIAQFIKGQFVFSRLNPYQGWNSFIEESIRLWKIFNVLQQTEEIRRIGIRYINQFNVPKGKIELGDYYKYPPYTFLDWDTSAYLHHDTYTVPDSEYGVNIIKTIHYTPIIGVDGLILDIDVFIQKSLIYSEIDLTKVYEELRWIKNKVFFSNITENVIKEYA